MCPARKFHHRDIAAKQGIYIGQMLSDRGLVSYSFIVLVPLVVIVEDHGDDFVETIDKAIWDRRADQAMKPAVEVGEVMKALVNLLKQLQMLATQGFQLSPVGR